MFQNAVKIWNDILTLILRIFHCKVGKLTHLRKCKQILNLVKNLYGNSNYVNETITLQGLELRSCNICYICVGRLVLKSKNLNSS